MRPSTSALNSGRYWNTSSEATYLNMVSNVEDPDEFEWIDSIIKHYTFNFSLKVILQIFSIIIISLPSLLETGGWASKQ
jgi:hypothetical protein